MVGRKKRWKMEMEDGRVHPSYIVLYYIEI